MTLSLTQGFSSWEAERRLAQIGPNAVVEPYVSPFVRIARRFWEPVPWMLEASIVLQLAIGERIEALVQRTPTGRLVTMEQVVDASRFLLENHAINGVNLPVDGGWLCT